MAVPAYVFGVQHALEKLGFNLRDARQLLKATKERVVRFRRDPLFDEAENYFARSLETPSGRVERIVAPSRGDISRVELKELAQEPKQWLTEHGYRLFPKETIKDIQAMSPKERLMREALARGHELDEVLLGQGGRLGSSTFRQAYGHSDPRVLLREHNRLTTLPASRKRVKRVEVDRRASSGEAQMLEQAIPGFRFGESPRLSRHAQRRLAPLLERAAQPAAQAEREATQQALQKELGSDLFKSLFG
jgi:hypothetical protein